MQSDFNDAIIVPVDLIIYAYIMVAHCAVIIIAHCALSQVMKMRYWRCDVRRRYNASQCDNSQQTLGTGHHSPARCWHLNNVGLLQNLPARIANILVRSSSRHTTQHSNMILRSESTRAVLVSSSIKATSHKISLERAPNVNSSWWQVWASVLEIRSGLGWGEERS